MARERGDACIVLLSWNCQHTTLVRSCFYSLCLPWLRMECKRGLILHGQRYPAIDDASVTRVWRVGPVHLLERGAAPALQAPKATKSGEVHLKRRFQLQLPPDTLHQLPFAAVDRLLHARVLPSTPTTSPLQRHIILSHTLYSLIAASACLRTSSCLARATRGYAPPVRPDRHATAQPPYIDLRTTILT